MLSSFIRCVKYDWLFSSSFFLSKIDIQLCDNLTVSLHFKHFDWRKIEREQIITAWTLEICFFFCCFVQNYVHLNSIFFCAIKIFFSSFCVCCIFKRCNVHLLECDYSFRWNLYVPYMWLRRFDWINLECHTVKGKMCVFSLKITNTFSKFNKMPRNQQKIGLVNVVISKLQLNMQIT